MRSKLYLITALALVSLALTGCKPTQSPQSDNTVSQTDKPIEVTMYKSPNCGCCVQHSAYLKENGFKVNIEMTDDMDAIKEKYNIPREMQSCHTIAMGDYFVEGHMPIEAITKLLTEKPDVDGIALPGMPSGSPGMPGPKNGTFEIYQLTGGQTTNFINL